MGALEKDQQAEPQPDADAEPSKKGLLTHQQRTAALEANPRFVKATGKGFIFMVNGLVPPKKLEG